MDSHMERNVVIVLGRCVNSKTGFGMRFERFNPNQWTATWAFAVKDAAAKREGYDQTRIAGAFLFDPAFPGCPHCHAKSFWLCRHCHHVACRDGETRSVTCPWCGSKGELSGTVEQLHARDDR